MFHFNTPSKKYALFVLGFLVPLLATAQFTKNSDSVLKVLKMNKKEDSVKVIDYARAAQLYNHQKPDSAIYYLNQGLIVARKVNFQRGIALLNSKLGTFYLDNGSYKKADSVFRIALSIHKALRRYEDQSLIYQSLSAVYSEAGDEVNSLKYILTAKQIAEDRSLVEQLPFCNGMIGISYQNQGDLNFALKYLKEGLRISEDLQRHHKFSTEARQYYNLTIQADLCTNIASILTDKKEYKQALVYYEQAIKTSKDGGFYDVNVLLFVNAAEVYRRINEPGKAHVLLDTALRLANQGDLYREKYKVYTQLGLLETKPVLAVPYFEKAIKLASDQKTDLMEIYQDVSAYLAEKGRFKDAFDALVKYNALKDSINSIEKAKQIANLKSLNQLQQSELKVKTLSLENYKVKTSSVVIAIISLVLLGLVITGYLYFKKLKKLHVLVIEQKNRLENLNDMKDKIFYIIGHDLRGPVASMGSLTEIMRAEFEHDVDVGGYLALLHKKQGHAMEILDKLLTWGKLEFQESSVPAQFNVQVALKVSLQDIISGASQKNINFQNEIPASLDIISDANHVDFIVRNLLQNALKFTPAGGTISLKYQLDNITNYHVLIISDSGIGMSKEKLSKLMFTAGTTPGTSNESGTGIGLMLVKKIAEQNKHTIAVESEVGRGTTFFYKIPI